MNALTLYQPWAWAVAFAGKSVENRTWRPPASAVGQELAIHAGQTIDVEAIATLQAWGFDVPLRGQLVRGAVVAVARLAGVVMPGEVGSEAFNPWLSGPYGWRLERVQALHAPVACRGNLGVWPVPAEVEREVREQLATCELGSAHDKS